MYLGTCMQTKKMAENNNYDIYLDGCKLNRAHEAKFMGITIDENFTLKKHVENVCKLCSRNIGVLMYRLYCSLVLPYLKYGLLLWGNENQYHINKDFHLQKRAMRLISNSEYLSPTKLLLEKFNTLNIFDMYPKEVAIFMFKYKNNMLPVSFDNFFTVNRENYNYNARNRNDFEIQMHKMKTIFTVGQKFGMSYQPTLKMQQKLRQFKTNLKSMLGKSL